MKNVKWRMKNAKLSLAVGLCSDDRLSDEVAELLAFVEQKLNTFGGKQFGFHDQFDPNAALRSSFSTIPSL